MIFPKAKKIAKKQNWSKTNTGVFGLYKGYFFNIFDSNLMSNPQYKFVVATTDNLSEQQRDQIYNELTQHKKNLKFTSLSTSNNGVTIQFAENLKYTKIKTVYALLDFLVDLFKRMNLSGQNKCHSCNTTEGLLNYNCNERGLILCDSCYHKIDTDFKDIERKKHSEEKNYFIGFLGSLLFSLPGIIVWVLVSIYLERLASIIAVLIGILGIKGYVFFKGKSGKLTKYLIILSNIISILVANIVTILSLLMKEGLSISESIAEMQINDVAIDMLNKNIIISFALTIVVWIWLFFSLKENKYSIKPAKKI